METLTDPSRGDASSSGGTFLKPWLEAKYSARRDGVWTWGMDLGRDLGEEGGTGEGKRGWGYKRNKEGVGQGRS